MVWQSKEAAVFSLLNVIMTTVTSLWEHSMKKKNLQSGYSTSSIETKHNNAKHSVVSSFLFFLFFLLFFLFWRTILLVMEVSSAASSHMTAQSNKQWIKSNTDVTHLMEHVLFATIIQRTNCMDVLLSFLVNMLHHMFGVNLETVLMNC